MSSGTCKGAKAILGGHNYKPAPNGWETCRNKGCTAKRRTPKPKTTKRSITTIKGRVWGNKADKIMAKDMQRKNWSS